MVLVGILSALAVQAFDRVVNPPTRYACVDVVTVVQERIEILAEAGLSGTAVQPAALSTVVDQVLAEMAADYGVTLIVKQAVVVGKIPDLTEEFRRRLAKQ